MQVNAVKTRVVELGDSICSLLDEYIAQLTERSIIAITSKIISLSEGRVIAKSNVANKYKLIQQEADAYLAEPMSVHDTHLTIKHQRIIPSAGIDESNVKDGYILYPSDSQTTSEKIWHHLREKHTITQLGVIITDSSVTPLRRGATGICIGWCGFEPLYNYIGQPDICDRPLQMTQINLLDALATAAVLVMGEGAEQTPLAIIQDAPKVSYLNRTPSRDEKNAIAVSMEEDLYSPILRNAEWIWRK